MSGTFSVNLQRAYILHFTVEWNSHPTAFLVLPVLLSTTAHVYTHVPFTCRVGQHASSWTFAPVPTCAVGEGETSFSPHNEFSDSDQTQCHPKIVVAGEAGGSSCVYTMAARTLLCPLEARRRKKCACVRHATQALGVDRQQAPAARARLGLGPV